MKNKNEKAKHTPGMKTLPMVTCDGNGAHDPITYAGYFTALCPLCAQIEKTADAVWSGADDVKNAVSEAEDRVRGAANGEADGLNDQIDTLREAVNFLEKEVKRLTP